MAPEPVRDCAALVLDGVWPYELMHPRPETEYMAQEMDRDLRKIVERTNEKLAELVHLNLAPAEYRAVEERFIRTAKAMAVLRVESTVRQLGGRSILGAQGMPRLTAPPVPRRGAAHDPLETTAAVGLGDQIRRQRMAQQREAEAGPPRVVPVVSPPYPADSPANGEQTVVFARHRGDGPSDAGEAVPTAAPADPLVLEHGEGGAPRPPVEVIDTGIAPPPQPRIGGYSGVGRFADDTDDGDGMTTAPVAPRQEYRGEREGQWPNPDPAGVGRHRDPAGSPEDADVPVDRSGLTSFGTLDEPEQPAPSAAPEPTTREPWRENAADEGISLRPLGHGVAVPPVAAPSASRESVPQFRSGDPSLRPSLRPAPPARPVNGAERVPVNGYEPVAPARPERPVRPSDRPSRPLALEQPMSLQQMVGSLARQQPSLKWLVAERADGTKVAVCEVMSGWIPPGIMLPVGVTVLPPEQRLGPMSGWVGPVANSALYGPGNRIERRNVPSLAGEEAFAVVDPAEDLGERVAEATTRPGLPRIANTLVRAAVSGSGVLPAELDVLNVHLETAVQMLLAEAPDVSAEEAVSCMLMGAAAAIAAGQTRLAAYHYGWFEAIAGRR